MAEQLTRAEEITSLVELLDRMEPFLDTAGRPHCYLKTNSEARSRVFSIRDRLTKHILFYQFHKEHGCYPRRAHVVDAIGHVEGGLLQNWPGPVVQDKCPVMMCFLRMAAEEIEGIGSAEDIRKELVRIRKGDTTLRRLEGRLPPNATAMGIWLTKNQLRLQTHGIFVHKLRRLSKTRPWEWWTVIRDGDACPAEVSSEASSSNPKEDSRNGRDDTFTNENLNDMLGDALS